VKTLIRRWLGLDELDRSINIAIQLLMAQRQTTDQIQAQYRVISEGMGIIVAKLEPLLGVREDDPDRVAASKSLGEDVMARLAAEQKIRDNFGYTPRDKHGEPKEPA
jgi:hypothetical protein